MVCNSKLVIIYFERFRQQILITLGFIRLSWASYVHAPCVTSVDEWIYTPAKNQCFNDNDDDAADLRFFVNLSNENCNNQSVSNGELNKKTCIVF